MSHPACCGLSRAHLVGLVEELAAPWTARCDSARHDRRGGQRRRAPGAGPQHRLVFTDRVLVTLVVLRFQLPHVALAELYGVDRTTVTRAVHEIRPLLATRGFAVPDRPGVRLRTLADVFGYAAAEGVRLRIDGTEVQVRRPAAHRPGRRVFVSGKRRQNTVKTTTISDGQGRTLWSGADRPGRMHDQTALRTDGIAEHLRLHPDVTVEVDEGYRGLANEFPIRSARRHASLWRTFPKARNSHGARLDGDNPRGGSAWSTRTPSTSSGDRSSGTSADASTMPRPTTPSPAWSPTAPPVGPQSDGRVQRSCSPGRLPADHPPAEPPGPTPESPSRTKP